MLELRQCWNVGNSIPTPIYAEGFLTLECHDSPYECCDVVSLWALGFRALQRFLHAYLTSLFPFIFHQHSSICVQMLDYYKINNEKPQRTQLMTPMLPLSHIYEPVNVVNPSK